MGMFDVTVCGGVIALIRLEGETSFKDHPKIGIV